MAARTRKSRLSIRGPSSPDLGQERPTDRLRPGTFIDLGVREDVGTSARPPVSPTPRR